MNARAKRRHGLAGATSAVALMVALGGCSPAPGQAGRASSPREAEKFRAYSLTVYGYNYTDTGIGSFEVNGRGGGNLEVSTPTAGGGKSACCASLYAPFPPDMTLHIKWTRDGDTWCTQDVPLQGPVPAAAEYLEVHFYRDGHIEAAVTAQSSPPRLQLTREHANSRHADATANVDNDLVHSRCKRGYD